MEKINIAIADDNERMQEMLGNVIKQDDTLELIGQTGNGNDIYSIIRDKEPDVVLLDIFMPKMDGLTVMEKVNEDKNLKKTCLYRCFRRRRGEDHRRCVPARRLLLRLKTVRQRNSSEPDQSNKRNDISKKIPSKKFYKPRKRVDLSAGKQSGNRCDKYDPRDRRSCPYQRIPVPARCDSAFRRGHGNAQFHYQDSLSDHRETPPDNVKSCRACHPPCD